jgi:hypothetical protein
MAISEEQIKRLVERSQHQLKPIANEARGTLAWTLNLPVAVIDSRTEEPVVVQSAVGALGGVLRVSTFIDHPLIQRLFSLYDDRGAEGAIEELLNDDEVSEEFAGVFDEYQAEKKAGKLMWGASDLTRFVMKSQNCFEDDELAVVAVLPAEAGDEGHQIATFGLPWRFFNT